jgi:hypothetical protein
MWTKCSLDFGNQWISSLLEFCCLLSQDLMVESLGMLESLRSNNGGERRWALAVFCRSEPLGKKRETLGKAEEKYKYHPAFQRSLKCGSAALSAAVLGCDTASLQVWHYCTHQDSKKVEIVGCLGRDMRMYCIEKSTWSHNFNQKLHPLDSTAFLYSIFKNIKGI